MANFPSIEVCRHNANPLHTQHLPGLPCKDLEEQGTQDDEPNSRVTAFAALKGIYKQQQATLSVCKQVQPWTRQTPHPLHRRQSSFSRHRRGPALLPLVPSSLYVSPSVFSNCSCQPPKPILELQMKGMCRSENRSPSVPEPQARSWEHHLTSPGHPDIHNLGYILCNEIKMLIAAGILPSPAMVHIQRGMMICQNLQ